MSYTWMKNYLGLKLTDEEFADIPHPRTEFVLHVTFKTALTGALIGAFSGPAICLAGDGSGNGCTTVKDLKDTTSKWGMTGAKYGLIAGPILSALVIKGVARGDKTRVYDWCFRTRCNPRQMRFDRLAILGTVAGCGAAVALNDNVGLGAIIGGSSGILTALFCSYIL